MNNAVYFKDGHNESIVAYNRRDESTTEFYTNSGKKYIFREYRDTYSNRPYVTRAFFQDTGSTYTTEFLERVDIDKIVLFDEVYTIYGVSKLEYLEERRCHA